MPNPQYAQAQQHLREQAREWVHRERPEVRDRWQAHQPGAYGDYLRAQLDALDHLDGPVAPTRELQNTLVRELSRYERQRRHEGNPEVLRKRHRAMTGRRRPL